MISVLLCLFGIVLFSAAFSVVSVIVAVRFVQKSGFLTIIFLIAAVTVNFFLFMFLMSMFPIVEWLA